MQSLQIIFVVDALLMLGLFFLVIWALLRFRGLRNELDDQGIKLIQLTNTTLELKKDQATLQSTITSIVDHLDRTNVRKDSLSENLGDNHQPVVLQSSSLSDERAGAVETRVRFKDEDDSDAPEDLLDEVVEESHPDEITGSREMNDDTNEEETRRQVEAASPSKGKEVPLFREFDEFSDFLKVMGGNVSKVGLFLPAKEFLPVGTRVEMELRLKDQTPLIRFKGEVKRLRNGDGGVNHDQQGMDIRFIYIDPSSKEMIRRLVGKARSVA